MNHARQIITTDTIQQIQLEISRALITRLEEIENRVPTDAEVDRQLTVLMKLGTCPEAGMRMWFWKGRRILTLFPPDYRRNVIGQYRLIVS